MRVTSAFFVSALTRRIFSDGGFAAVVSHGADEAGAIYFTLRDRMGQVTLYGPAPQSAYDERKPDERLFRLMLKEAEDEAVEAKLARERRFDPDVWVLDVELGSKGIDDYIALVKDSDAVQARGDSRSSNNK
ncbi:DUF1491 family protein [Limoniibacter endophyticus]|nr:DUF1491 family protein [Limoniibacter endophyticus]